MSAKPRIRDAARRPSLDRSSRSRAAVAAGLAAVAAAVLAPGPAIGSSAGVERADPIVVSAAALPKLAGAPPSEIVAFRFRDPRRGKPRWRQVPVQVDERKPVDFGAVPADNSSAGLEGTVYGTEPIGEVAMQYADPRTFVGPDPQAGVDADDEIVLLAADSGERAGKRQRRPRGTAGGRTRLRVSDPLGGPGGFLYLFRAKPGRLDAAAGRNLVTYDFRLESGDYRGTYRRADGPNPEVSSISTDAYTVGFSDRWFYDELAIRAGGASGVDVLDGFKFQFGPTTCGRSEATFSDGEGAFVANVDGPLRAIRAYVGANSGPLTQRTHLFYPDRHEIVTDLRVHPVPGPLTYHDMSSAGLGMSYSTSADSLAAPVDGVEDELGDAPVSWHMWTGPQGSLVSLDRIESSFETELMANASAWHLDRTDPPPSVQRQCWGDDDDALGQGGIWSTYSLPNTDPRSEPAATLRATTTDLVAGPGLSAAGAGELAARVDSPLAVAVR